MDDKKEYQRIYQKRNFVFKKMKAVEYKGGSCCKCGYDSFYGALEFHHRDPTSKEFDWERMRRKSWATIKEELDKCDLLCANCHREIHSDPLLVEEIMEWRKSIDNKKLKFKTCVVCEKLFKPKRTEQFLCSTECSLIFRNRGS